MKNKSLFYALVCISSFIIAVSLIYAYTNIQNSKRVISSYDDNIIKAVDSSISMCKIVYDEVNATELERKALNQYLENIEKYNNAGTKANIAIAMIEQTSDLLLKKEVNEYVDSIDYAALQLRIVAIKSQLEASKKYSKS